MGRLKTHAEFIEQVKHRPFDVVGQYVRDKVKIELKCHNCGGTFFITPTSVLQNNGCPLCKSVNKILEDHGDWLLVDISTPKYTGATMAVDSDVWKTYKGGRVFAEKTSAKYIYARYNDLSHNLQLFHRDVITGSKYLDHIVHGTMIFVDNRRSNLRPATDSQNMMNKSLHKNNTSGHKGVCFHKPTGKWTATIRINKKSNHLGTFVEKEDAIAARRIAEEKHYGEYLLKSKPGAAIC